VNLRRPVELVTADGVSLHSSWSPARHSGDGGTLVVVAPGFTGHGRLPVVGRLVARLTARADVLVVDLRGHGRSGGRCTLGAAEPADVEAAVSWARGRGYDRVATLGFSFGGAVVLCHAGLLGGVDAVAAVSAPSRWYIRDTPVMRRLHPMAETAGGRALARAVFKVRLTDGWTRVPPSPVEVVDRIAPTPLLLVHGDADTYFPVEHPLALAAAAGPGCELWLERGFGHAENALTSALADRVAGWLVAPARVATSPASGTICE
jgi:pimeloyl-ACP methyl ester carboxylesterase